MSLNAKLKQEVRDLYNKIFPWQIDPNERNVSKVVILGFTRLYGELNYEVAASTCLRLHNMHKIKPECTKLEICKKLLLGLDVRLPGSATSFNIREIYSHFVPGEKININLKNEHYN